MDLAILSKWSRRWVADGVVLAAPAPGGEWLRVRTQQRPVRPFRELVGDSPLGALERFATAEGEQAGFILAREPTELRAFAMIVGDDSYAFVEGRAGLARESWLCDLVRTVARCYPLGLGAPRRRRYLYQPPYDFQGLQRPGCVCWLNAEFPRVSGRITVYDARPLKWFVPGAVDRFLFVDENPFAHRDPPIAPVYMKVRPGLAGWSTRVEGRELDGTPIGMVKTILQDATYYYAVQLDARIAEWDLFAPAYEAVLASIEALPKVELNRSVNALLHWTD